MRANKKKLNLTVDEEILRRAKELAEFRGESLSSLVESFLSELVADMETTNSEHWLKHFHHKYLKEGFQSPSDAELNKLRGQLIKKHS